MKQLTATLATLAVLASGALMLLGTCQTEFTAPDLMTQIAKTLVWMTAFGLLGLSLAPAIASAPQRHYEIQYAIVGGIAGLIIGILIHRPPMAK